MILTSILSSLENEMYKWRPSIGDIVLNLDGMEYQIVSFGREFFGIENLLRLDIREPKIKMRRLHTCRTIYIEALESQIQFSCYEEFEE